MGGEFTYPICFDNHSQLFFPGRTSGALEGRGRRVVQGPAWDCSAFWRHSSSISWRRTWTAREPHGRDKTKGRGFYSHKERMDKPRPFVFSKEKPKDKETSKNDWKAQSSGRIASGVCCVLKKGWLKQCIPTKADTEAPVFANGRPAPGAVPPQSGLQLRCSPAALARAPRPQGPQWHLQIDVEPKRMPRLVCHNGWNLKMYVGISRGYVAS